MSALGLGLGLGLSRVRGGESPDMILVYAIPESGTNIELAIQANSTWFSAGQAVVINWGDGSAKETVSDTGGSTYIGHTYASAGTYTIKISGSMTMYGRTSDVDILGQTLLTRVDSFGKLGITSFRYAFHNCSGLLSVPKTLPDSVTSMFGMFRACTGAAFNPDVSGWNVSKVTTMYQLFHTCNGAAFNPDVSGWNVSKVTDMFAMFYNCNGAAFNPVVSGWNVSKVTDMQHMFYNCTGAAFNPDVSGWNVSKVTDMYRMFRGCSGGAFRGGRGGNGNGIAKWQLKTGDNPVVMTQFMLSSKTQEPAFLDDILNAWAALHTLGLLPTNITVDFGNNKYTTDGAAAYTTLTTITDSGGAGWTITSGGLTS